MVQQGKVFFSILLLQAFAAAHPFDGVNGGDECGPRTITVEAPCPTVPASTVTSTVTDTVTDTVTPTPEIITNVVTDTVTASPETVINTVTDAITAPAVTVTDTVTASPETVTNTVTDAITDTLTDTTTAPGATVTMDITSINISADITDVPGPTAAAPTGAAHPGAINYGSCSDPTINWESGPGDVDLFVTNNQLDFPHDTTPAIGNLNEFVCDRLADPCHAPAGTIDLCQHATNQVIHSGLQCSDAANFWNNLIIGRC